MKIMIKEFMLYWVMCKDKRKKCSRSIKGWTPQFLKNGVWAQMDILDCFIFFNVSIGTNTIEGEVIDWFLFWEESDWLIKDDKVAVMMQKLL
jgi:hypothetical protein